MERLLASRKRTRMMTQHGFDVELGEARTDAASERRGCDAIVGGMLFGRQQSRLEGEHADDGNNC